MIADLESFWSQKGCTILQPYDLPMGAGTSHPATIYHAVQKNPSAFAFVQPCRRPGDGRYGDNPCRIQKFHQFQVLITPEPGCVEGSILESYQSIGINLRKHDVKFVEDDWENPSLGAVGLGWEVWIDGTEVTQVTYFQKMGGLDCPSLSIELSYGIERIGMFLQDADNMMDLAWQKHHNTNVTVKDLFHAQEKELSEWSFEKAPVIGLTQHDHLKWGQECINNNLPLPAYEHSLHANYIFNVLDARGAISVTDRTAFIGHIRNLVGECCKKWIQN